MSMGHSEICHHGVLVSVGTEWLRGKRKFRGPQDMMNAEGAWGQGMDRVRVGSGLKEKFQVHAIMRG